MKKIVLALSVGIVGASSAFAVPQLQLDIAGGTYDNASQTIVAGQNAFTLYALYDAANGAPSGNFYISASISPKTSLGDFGSFSIGGTSYSSALGNMNFGTPPVFSAEPNLHDVIFPTYFAQIGFEFSETQKAALYDSQVNPGGLVADPTGSLLYQAFTVNISGLAEGTIVHFDLYNSFHLRDIGGDSSFAPFTHDAQSGMRVPDVGSALALLGVGLASCAFLKRKFGKDV